MTVTTALYRRYRPDSFADVIGQEHVTEPLMTALRKNRVNHAYLFSGPRGCGKTTSARILARCLNCAKGPTDTPCGVCPSCIELARGGAGSLDVIEIDAASHGGVDDARDLRERATYAPVRDRYKIFIIDEAHMVTSAGFNALLKIVEEPPEHIKFIFATTEPDKVIGTIRSRTHHYPFRLVPPEPLMAYLEQLCHQENVPVAPGVLSLVIRAGAGSVRDSLSVLDQLMAGAGPNGLDYELAVALLGYTHASLLDDVVEAIAASDAATVFRAVDRVIQTGHDPRRFVEDLLERFRDLIIVQAMPESAQAILRGMPADQIARMQSQAHNLGAAELSRAADVTNTALTEMTGATSPRLHLELLCARILLPSSEQTERGIAARIDRVERRLNYAGSDAGAPAAAAVGPAAAAPAAAAPAPAAAPAAPAAPVAPVAPVAQAAASAAVPPAVPVTPAASAAPAPASAQGAPQLQGPPSIQAAPAAEDAPGREALAAPRITTGDWPMDDAAALDRRPAPDSHGGENRGPAAQRPADSPASAAGPEQAQRQQTQHEQRQRPEPAAAQAAPSAPAPQPHAQPSSGAATAGAAPAGSHADVEVLRRAWPEVLQTLAKIKRSTWALVEPNAQVGQFDGQVLTLVFSTSGLAGAFGRADHSENLRQAIHKTIGIDCQITAMAGAGSSASSEPNPKAPTSRDIPATTTDADWGLAPNADGRGRQEPAPVHAEAAAAAPASPVPAAVPAPGNASPSSSATPAVSVPQWSGPTITPSLPDAAAPAGAGSAPGASGTAAPAAPAASVGTGSPAGASGRGLSAPAAQPVSAQEKTAHGLQQQESGDYSYPDDDWGPPLDEDAPPLDEEPPMDWEPSRQWQGSPAPSAGPEIKAPAPKPPVESAPSAAQTHAESAAPVQADRQPAPGASADPWTRAVEQTPGVWALSSESNVGKYPGAGNDRDEQPTGSAAPVYPPAAAQPPNNGGPAAGGRPSAAPGESARGERAPDPAVSAPAESAPEIAGRDVPEFEPAYAMASAPATAGHEYGAPTPAQGVRAPAVTAATDAAPVRVPVFASGPGPAMQARPAMQAGPAIQAGPKAQPGSAAQAGPAVAAARTAAPEPASEAPARGKLSLYQRLSNSPEAEAGRAKAPVRSTEEPAPYVQDIPSADDETIEESGVFGRAAVERILGGKLIEERSLGGSPLAPRY
ncbi:DNA polymerase III subunit gamma and tau [Arthrobacter sp. NPDC056493]|uniref:DNA polymerase III subunit gamma and tau n=1 Tax=Arthrobacter sp. NPDC056493 TaxID=3345839 RepID=UPI00366CD5CB